MLTQSVALRRRGRLDFETSSLAGYEWDAQRERWTGPNGAEMRQAGLSAVGAYKYSIDPTCYIVWAAYDLEDGLGWRTWFPDLPPPVDLFEHVRDGHELSAWNVGFERWLWENVCVPRYGWPEMREEQWFCSMAKARAASLPGGLDHAARVMQLGITKDERGAALIKKFSIPHQPSKTDPRVVIYPTYLHPGYPPGAKKPERDRIDRDHADTWAFGEYNVRDIQVEEVIDRYVPDLEGEELAWWRCHERINRRGVYIDREGVENCVAIIEQAFQRYHAELFELTGIDSASKGEQLLGWLHSRGVHLDSIDEETVEAALKLDLPAECRRVLEIRAAVGSASVKKLYAIRNRTSADGYLRDLYVYYGAHTGRSTGEGPQPTNLPKAGPDLIGCGVWDKDKFVEGTGCRKHYGTHHAVCPHCGTPRYPTPKVFEWNPTIAEECLESIRSRSLDWIEHLYGPALHVVAGCLRALFIAPPEHDLISSDYNSIEAVGLAMVSGEKWRIDVFNGDGKIYERSASMTFHVLYEEFEKHRKAAGQHHPLRQKGKIGELAYGYQGWLGAARAFDAPGTDEELKADILAWRAASPAIEWLWGGQTLGKAGGVYRNATAPSYTGTVDDRLSFLRGVDRFDDQLFLFGVEGKAIEAILDQAPLGAGVRGPWVDVARLDGTSAGIKFQSDGRNLYCRIPSGRILTYRNALLLQGDRDRYSLSFERWNTNPKYGPKGWFRTNTWGGRLVENIIQATCRDILRAACIRLEAAGYEVCLHVYDEIVARVRKSFGSIEEFERLMTVRPDWAFDWPIKAPGGYRTQRYRKG